MEGLTGTSGDPFDAVRDVVSGGTYDGVIVSTLPRRVSKWLRLGLHDRVARLGLPVEVITPKRDRMLDGGPWDSSGDVTLPPAGMGGGP